MNLVRHQPRPPASNETGFSLIEALVALTILSIAGVAFIQVAQSHSQSLDRLETGALGGIVVENHLTELRIKPSLVSQAKSTTRLADRDWAIQTDTKPTSDPDLLEVHITAFEAATRVQAADITAFIDIGASK